MRSHDQYNTTIYGLNDRYRGVKGGRRVVLVHPDDLEERGLRDGDHVDLVSEWDDGERRAERFRATSYPTARGCAAAYFPEANSLVPLDSTAEGSNTPTSKSIVIRLEPAGMSRHHAMVERDGVLDAVAVEEPLEIRVAGEPVAVTMRTPGHDEELALGFLYGEGLIDRAWEVGLSDDLAANTVDVKGELCRPVDRRRFYTTSSCGVCGKGAIEEVTVDTSVPAAGARDVARAPGRSTGAPEPARVRAHRRPARHRPLLGGRRAAARARGRRPPQRDGQGGRPRARAKGCCRCTATCCA